MCNCDGCKRARQGLGGYQPCAKNGRTYSLIVIGKVPNPQFDCLWYWVLGYGEDYPVIVGSNTVYKYLDGGRCGTMLYSECYDITSRAEFKEAAGTQYKIYTWKELIGE